MEFICALGKTFYIVYITGNVEQPNINVTYTLRVSFTQTNSFVSGETKALMITISFIYSSNIQALRQRAAGKLSINTSVAKLSQGTQA